MPAIEGSGHVNIIHELSPASGAEQPQQLAVAALARIGGRIESWVPLVRGQTGGGVALPDLGRLEAGGDVYGLRTLARELGAATQASPTDEGRLLRALEDVTRGVAVRLFGLAGAPDSVRLADILDAIRSAAAEPTGRSAAPIDELIGRLETAAQRLGRAI